MQLTIIKEDNKVYIDGEAIELDLSDVSFPENFWALQWNGSSGHIEYVGADILNDTIDTLPDWTNACITKWQERKAEIEAEAAAEAAAAAAAEAAAQTP